MLTKAYVTSLFCIELPYMCMFRTMCPACSTQFVYRSKACLGIMYSSKLLLLASRVLLHFAQSRDSWKIIYVIRTWIDYYHGDVWVYYMYLLLIYHVITVMDILISIFLHSFTKSGDIANSRLFHSHSTALLPVEGNYETSYLLIQLWLYVPLKLFIYLIRFTLIFYVLYFQVKAVVGWNRRNMIQRNQRKITRWVCAMYNFHHSVPLSSL